MKKIVIFGNQSIAGMAHYYFSFDSHYKVSGFVVDKDYIESRKFLDLPVYPFEDVKKVFPPNKYLMFIAVGYVQNNRIRKERYLQAKEMGYKLVNCISPKSDVYPGAVRGENCMIGHFSAISPECHIGNNILIGAGTIISHDVKVGDHCFISSSVSISGYVNIGESCFFGTSSTVRNKVNIGNECIIGSGANIFEDVKDKSVIMGLAGELLPVKSDKLPVG